MRKKLIVFIVLIISVLLSCEKQSNELKELDISVAASLLEPIKEISLIYEEENNIKININSGGSGTLKKQISQGADVGLFISASKKHMDELQSEGLVLKERIDYSIKNTLVVVVNKDIKISVKAMEDLINIEGKIAIGEINTVPAGEYAKESIDNSKIWTSIEGNLIYCKDVTAVKTYVERGEALAGFIYGSDAYNLSKSEIAFVVPENLHKEVVYAIAPINEYRYYKEIAKLIELINSQRGQDILKKYGFIIGV